MTATMTTAARGGGVKFSFWQKKMLSAPFLMPAETKILVILSASVKRFGFSRNEVKSVKLLIVALN